MPPEKGVVEKKASRRKITKMINDQLPQRQEKIHQKDKNTASIKVRWKP